jgi:hypothetical protein
MLARCGSVALDVLPSGHSTVDEYVVPSVTLPGIDELLPCEAWHVMHARVTTETFPFELLTLTPELVWRKAKISSPLSTLLDSAGVGPFRVAR